VDSMVTKLAGEVRCDAAGHARTLTPEAFFACVTDLIKTAQQDDENLQYILKPEASGPLSLNTEQHVTRPF
jgi:hypothetical protein